MKPRTSVCWNEQFLLQRLHKEKELCVLMNKMDSHMVDQLRSLALIHTMPSLDLIADRMKTLAELSVRVSLIPPNKIVDK